MFASDNATLKLGDFGVAVRLPKTPGSLLKERIGTPAFMAPEMHQLPNNSKGYDQKVDVWACGVLLVFLLHSENPYVDKKDRLMRAELIKGEVPLWEKRSLMGLFTGADTIGDYLFGPKIHQPSDLAKQMVRSLLVPDPVNRCSARRARDHVWYVLVYYVSNKGTEQRGRQGRAVGGEQPDIYCQRVEIMVRCCQRVETMLMSTSCGMWECPSNIG